MVFCGSIYIRTLLLFLFFFFKKKLNLYVYIFWGRSEGGRTIVFVLAKKKEEKSLSLYFLLRRISPFMKPNHTTYINIRITTA